MIVASGHSEAGVRLLALGLTRDNVEELMKGRPILVDREHHGESVPVDLAVCVFYGDTKADLVRQLAPFMDADTNVDHRT